MEFNKFELNGTNIGQLDTEIRYCLASAKVDGCSLINFTYPAQSSKEESKIRGCIARILRSLRAEKKLQFFVDKASYMKPSTEAEFLNNKYSSYINEDFSENEIYVKL